MPSFLPPFPTQCLDNLKLDLVLQGMTTDEVKQDEHRSLRQPVVYFKDDSRVGYERGINYKLSIIIENGVANEVIDFREAQIQLELSHGQIYPFSGMLVQLVKASKSRYELVQRIVAPLPQFRARQAGQLVLHDADRHVLEKSHRASRLRRRPARPRRVPGPSLR